MDRLDLDKLSEEKKVRILLIHPPWGDVYGNYAPAARVGVLYPPLGLCYVAACLKQDGKDVRIIDAEAEGKNIQAIVSEAKEYSPDIIGITSTTPIFHKAKELGHSLKRELNVPIIIGGSHPTVTPIKTMQECSAFDYLVFGEAELTFVELVNSIRNGRTVEGIKGVAYRKNGEIIKNESRPFIEDLDSIPFPARELLNLDNYLWSVPKKGIVKFATIFTTRGCPFKCVYCAARNVFGGVVRERKVENVVDEIEQVIQKFGIKHFSVLDDTLTLNRQRAQAICKEIIRRNLDITIEGFTRVNTIDEETLRWLKKAGLVRISFGIESGNPEILKLIKKGITLDQVKEAYRIAKKVGLETRGSIIIGLPGDTRKTAMQTLNFAKSLKGCDQMYINICTPYPGTELYDMAVNSEHGFRLLTKDFSKYKRYGEPVLEVNDLNKEELVKLQKKGFLMFYLTPRRIYHNLVRAGPKAAAKNINAFFKSVFK